MLESRPSSLDDCLAWMAGVACSLQVLEYVVCSSKTGDDHDGTTPPRDLGYGQDDKQQEELRGLLRAYGLGLRDFGLHIQGLGP